MKNALKCLLVKNWEIVTISSQKYENWKKYFSGPHSSSSNPWLSEKSEVFSDY